MSVYPAFPVLFDFITIGDSCVLITGAAILEMEKLGVHLLCGGLKFVNLQLAGKKEREQKGLFALEEYHSRKLLQYEM